MKRWNKVATHARLVTTLVAIGMIGVGVSVWLSVPIACVVVGGLVWLDLSIGGKG